MTGETENSLKPNMLVSAVVVDVREKFVRCRLDNGISGFINASDASDSVSFEDVGFTEGMTVMARIKEIRTQHNVLSVTLTTRSSMLNNKYIEDQMLSEMHSRDNYFVKEDYGEEMMNKIKKKKKEFLPRRVEHPQFRNIGEIYTRHHDVRLTHVRVSGE